MPGTSQNLSDAIQLANKKAEILRRIRGSGPAPNFNAENYFRKERHAKKIIRRLLKKARKGWLPPVVDNDMLAAKFKENVVLDALVPKRKDLWLGPLKRRKFADIKIPQFSFLDDPETALDALKQIAICDATLAGYNIHFDLDKCEDVSPFIVLGLMREGMTQAASGGRLTRSVAQMIEAVGLKRFLSMKVITNDPTLRSSSDIWPLPLQTKDPGQATAPSQAFAAQRKEKVTDSFVEAIDGWLEMAAIDDCYYQLTKTGKGRIAAIFSELLDNAERHTIPNDDRGGGWRVAGFMARKKINGAEQFVCNISIVSLGMTIGESLRRAEDPEVAAKLDQYCARHRSVFGNDTDADDLLRTVCALQDRVSRVGQSGSNPHGGVGIMDMIEVVNELGRAPSEAVQPQVTIYSGNSCVMIRAPYARGVKSATDPNSPRTLWLNAVNTLEIPPDPSHVFKGKLRFPGTIVTARFSIDEKYLASLGDTNA